MSYSSQAFAQTLYTSRIAVPTGATLAVLVAVSHIPGVNNVVISQISGGTLEIHGVTFGVTISAAAAASLSGTGFQLNTSTPISILGAPWFYASSTGATSVLQIVASRGAAI